MRNVLFLCTGNSARSIMAEAYLNAIAGDRVRAYSAGSHPKGDVHHLTIQTLQLAGVKADGLRSKSWDEFARADAPKMDLVVTVCDAAAGEVCPVFPGQPVKEHWSFPDPASFEGSEEDRRRFFGEVFGRIQSRIDQFLDEAQW